MAKNRIPRKKKKQIPNNTPYCYSNYGRVGVCPFYEHLEDVDGFCTLMNRGVEDQIKSCGISCGYK